jgi:hypothetical protein
MTISIDRPASAKSPGGLLGYDKFQIAYVTNDLDRAVDIFRAKHNIRNWTIFDGGVMHIALAWVNGQQIELIQTHGAHQPLYDDWIDKAGDFVIRHHHFGYFVYSDAEWQQLRAQLKTDGRALPMAADTEMLKVIYAEAPELGHYLEYIYPNEKGKAFFESVASN